MDETLSSGVNVSVATHGWNHRAYLSSADSPSNRVAAAVLRGVYADVAGSNPGGGEGEGGVGSTAETRRDVHRHTPTVRYEGGSIPVVKHIEALTGTPPAIMAFSLGSDGVHSPNEFFPVARFALVTKAYVRALFEAARVHAADRAPGKEEMEEEMRSKEEL